MRESVRRIALFTKSALFTIVIHGILLAALVAGLWWPFSEKKIESGAVTPIQATVISAEEIQHQVDIQKTKIEEQEKIAKNIEELKQKQEEEKQKLEELELKRQQDEQEKMELEEQKILEEERNRLDAEKKKKEDEEKKRIEAEKKQKQEVEKKQKEAERKEAEQALKQKIEAEQEAQTKQVAKAALEALKDQIKLAVERNWVRPATSDVGLRASILVKLSQSGDVISVNVVKSSGDAFFDRSAELAIRKTSPLPFPSNPKYYKYIREFNFSFNPDDF